MRIALDTSLLIELFRGHETLAQFLSQCSEIWIPLTVLGEMKAGIHASQHPEQNEALLNRFMAKPTVGTLLPSAATAEQYGLLFAQLRRAQTPIPQNDLWIAAMALQHGLTLLTKDQHFARIPQLLQRNV